MQCLVSCLDALLNVYIKRVTCVADIYRWEECNKEQKKICLIV